MSTTNWVETVKSYNMASKMSSKKSPTDKSESVFDKVKEKISELKNNIEEKMNDAKEKVDGKALVMLGLGCAS